MVEVNWKNKVNGQHNYGAILGAPIGIPKIDHQADSGTVEPNRAVNADVQKKCGDILGAPIGVPKIERQADIEPKISRTCNQALAWRPA